MRLILAALLVFLALGSYAEDVLKVENPAGSYRVVTWDWTSDSSGNAQGLSDIPMPGVLYKAFTTPKAGDTAPSDNYDITVKEKVEAEDGTWTLVDTDVALSELINRDTSTTEKVDLTATDTKPVFGRLQINITNAGAANCGRLKLVVYAQQFARKSSNPANLPFIEGMYTQAAVGTAPVSTGAGTLQAVDIATQAEFDAGVAAKKYVVEGDSISNTAGLDWPYVLATISPHFATSTHVNYAVSGETVAQMVTEYESEAGSVGPEEGRDDYYFFLFGGVNDLNTGGTGAAIYENLKTLWAAARADGYTVVAFTVMHSTALNAGEETERLALNALILSDTSLYDYVVQPDRVLDPRVNPEMFLDATHPNADGHLLLAQTVVKEVSVKVGAVDSPQVKVGSIGTAQIASTAVTAGSYSGPFTTDADGRITAARTQKNSIWLLADDAIPGISLGCGVAEQFEAASNRINYIARAFSDASDTVAYFNTILPSDYDGGQVTFRVYWTCSGSSAGKTVNWNLTGYSFGNDNALNAAMPAATAITDTWLADGDLHVAVGPSAITLGGSPAANELCSLRLWRDVSEDDLGVAAYLIAVEIEYTPKTT